MSSLLKLRGEFGGGCLDLVLFSRCTCQAVMGRVAVDEWVYVDGRAWWDDRRSEVVVVDGGLAACGVCASCGLWAGSSGRSRFHLLWRVPVSADWGSSVFLKRRDEILGH